MEAMDPEENKQYKKLIKALEMDNKQLADAAKFTNDKYPNIELKFDIEDQEGGIVSGEPAYLNVSIEREVDDDDEESQEVDLKVHAPFYPGDKTENWWLVVGDEASKTLLTVKRVTIGKKLDVRLEFVVPTAGKKELTLYLMSDSYVGVDQAPTFEVDVAQGEEDEDEEDEDEEMEE